MSRLALALAALSFPGPQDVDLSGRWLVYKPSTDRVELDRFTLVLGREGGVPVGTLVLPELELPLAGEIDDEGRWRLSASADGRTAGFVLWLEGESLVGNLDQWGTPYPLSGERATPEREAVQPFKELVGPEVEWPIEYPETVTRRGIDGEAEAEVRGAVLTLMEERRVVGVSLAIVRGGDVVDVRGFGWEDFHAELPASGETRYRWASVTKPLTAMLTLLLTRDGDLELTDEVREHVPEWPQRHATITVGQLLTHQAGVPHYDGLRPRTLREYRGEHPWTDSIVALDMFSESDLVYTPGRGFQYSTPGYVLLGAVLGRAGGKPYTQLVEDRIARPLGLTTLRPDRAWEPIEHRAVGYGHSKGRVLVQAVDDISWKVAAGGWISTVGDLGRFVTALMGHELLGVEAQVEMYTERHTFFGTPTGFGYGVRVHRSDDGFQVFHSGGQLGASSYIACLPDEELGVALMGNTEGVSLGDLAREILRILR